MANISLWAGNITAQQGVIKYGLLIFTVMGNVTIVHNLLDSVSCDMLSCQSCPVADKNITVSYNKYDKDDKEPLGGTKPWQQYHSCQYWGQDTVVKFRNSAQIYTWALFWSCAVCTLPEKTWRAPQEVNITDCCFTDWCVSGEWNYEE